MIAAGTPLRATTVRKLANAIPSVDEPAHASPTDTEPFHPSARWRWVTFRSVGVAFAAHGSTLWQEVQTPMTGAAPGLEPISKSFLTSMSYRKIVYVLKLRDDQWERLCRHAAARLGPHCGRRQRMPRSAGTRLWGVSSWPLPQRFGGKTVPRTRFGTKSGNIEQVYSTPAI